MNKLKNHPLQSSDGSLTFVGFSWAMAAILGAFFIPIVSLVY